MTNMVPLTEAEEVLKIKLHDLLLDPEVHIETPKRHGILVVDPQKMMEAKHFIDAKKEQHGK